MNNIPVTVGVIIAIIAAAAGGYITGKNSVDSVDALEVQQMTNMMRTDGARMEKAGGMMLDAGAMMESRGAKYGDAELSMKGKDLSANGRKHQEDGRSMMGNDMMGITAQGNMDDMPGMNIEGVDSSKIPR